MIDIFEYNFTCLIVGSRGCGKTFLATNLIISPIITYDKLTIISKSGHQPTYRFLCNCYENFLPKNIINNIFNQYTPEIVEDIIHDEDFESSEIEFEFVNDIDGLKKPEEFNNGLTDLILADDLITGKQDPISDICSFGRHYDIKLIYLTQDYIKTPRFIRKNIDIFIFFSLGLRDVESVYRDYASSDMSYKEFKMFCKNAWQVPYNFIVIIPSKNKWNGKFREGLTQIYIPQTSPF